MKKFIAHINGTTEQDCNSHSVNAAAISKNNLKDIRLDSTGYIAALIHDCGKYHPDFTDYILKSANGEQVLKGSVIHSFAAVRMLLEKHTNNSDFSYYDIILEILACAIGSHHGLFDIFDSKHKCGFTHRIEKQPEKDIEAIINFFKDTISKTELEQLLIDSEFELRDKIGIIDKISADEKEICFYLGCLCRLISSSVMDGDRKDTAEFMMGQIVTNNYDASIWHSLQNNFNSYVSNFKQNTNIQKARSELSDICFKIANNPSGIYKINIPTGGGKTLSTMRYALEHCIKYNKQRIFYIAPLISILEQNAHVLKEALGIADAVLLHHSNVINDDEQDETRSLLCETWDSPVVITTLVQFLNTCFLGKTSSVRRFNSLVNSVIIIDEVQTVPNNMLTLFNLMMNFLANVCKCSVILCSATQPLLEKVEHRLLISDKNNELNDKFKPYFSIFKRNKIIPCEEMTLDEISGFVNQINNTYDSVLVICNKKIESEYLFNCLNNDSKRFHLSASMCMSHRRKVLNDINEALKQNEKIVCISTQVIEAGVDISFSAVVRFAAGMDSIIQSAGRCNRNMEFDINSPVFVVNCIGENLKMLQEIQSAKGATLAVFEEYKNHPERYNDDLSSKAAIDFYYSYLYKQMPKNFQDYVVKDNPSLYSLLSDNACYRGSNTDYYLAQAFKTAGQLFEVFDSSAYTVIVPYGNGKNLINELCSLNADDFYSIKRLVKKASEYSVTVYDYAFKKLIQNGGVYGILDNMIYVLDEAYYNENTGMVMNIKEMEEIDKCNILML